jgi:hypothetical protein
MPNVMFCLKGHYVGIVNSVIRARSSGQIRALMERASIEDPHSLPAFCSKCGAANISDCQHCGAAIKPRLQGDIPSYCGRCGQPFPWTEHALSAANEFTDELSELTTEDKVTLKSTFIDLTSDTARTPVAATRFRKFMKKIGPGAADVLTKTLVSVSTEAAKKLMGL